MQQDIYVGQGPDFLLRRGHEELFHSTTIRVKEREGGNFKTLAKLYDRSLYSLAKKAGSVLPARTMSCSYKTSQPNKPPYALYIEFKNFTYEMTYPLHTHLDIIQRRIILLNFSKFVRDFHKSQDTL